MCTITESFLMCTKSVFMRNWPSYAPDELEAVQRVLASGKVNYWTGNECRLFEQDFAQTMGCRYGVALANGSLALELALIALDIGPGDEVVLTPRTFLASASSIILQGARPVFADVDPESENITAETIQAVLTERTRAVICVHLHGRPCDMDPILALANKHGLWVIEDCAQAHGALYKGTPVGGLGHVAAWSFCQDKIMSTGGEGGMLTTNNLEIRNKAWSYKDHGKSYEKVYHQKHPPGFRWLHDSFGSNWRMTEIQATLGRVQLGKLEQWGAKRRAHAAALTQHFLQIPALRVPLPPDDIRHARYKYSCFLRTDRLKTGWDRDRIMQALIAEGVPCFSGICPEVYLEKAFANTDFQPPSRLPVAKTLGETSLMFLVHPTLSQEDIQAVCRAMDSVMARAGG